MVYYNHYIKHVKDKTYCKMAKPRWVDSKRAGVSAQIRLCHWIDLYGYWYVKIKAYKI